jgi:hypothetical protein
MDDMTAETRELSEQGTIQTKVSDHNREIKKWQSIAKMVDSIPDVLPFSHSITEPERRWVFYARASGIVQQSVSREIDDAAEMSEAVVAIF